jgi:hypothetical protein
MTPSPSEWLVHSPTPGDRIEVNTMSEPAPVSELETRFILLPYPGLSYSQVGKQLQVTKPALIKWGGICCSAINHLRKGIDALVQPPALPKTPATCPSTEVVYEERKWQAKITEPVKFGKNR